MDQSGWDVGLGVWWMVELPADGVEEAADIGPLQLSCTTQQIHAVPYQSLSPRRIPNVGHTQLATDYLSAVRPVSFARRCRNRPYGVGTGAGKVRFAQRPASDLETICIASDRYRGGE